MFNNLKKLISLVFATVLLTSISSTSFAIDKLHFVIGGGAGGGSNRLEFKEIGEGNDNWGMALDDIQMTASSITHTGSLSDNSGLDVNFGADGKGSYELASKAGWTLSSDKSTLTKDDGSLIVRMNSSNGEYSVEQLKPTTLGDISIPVKVTDGDGDSATTNINISVENKTPELPDSIIVKLVDSDSVLEGETLAHRVKLYDANGNEVAVPEGEYVEVTLTYTTSSSNGAVEDVDYTSQNTVRIYGGTSGTYVFNDTLTDNSYEGSESYTVSVSNVSSSNSEVESKLNISTQTVTGTIVDGNTPPEADDRHFEIDCDDTTYTNGLASEYYGVNTQISNLEQFKSIVSDNNPDATFTATTINYGQGSGTVSKGTNLQEFLKGDAASLSTDPGDTSDGGIFMTGKVYLEAGTYNFKVLADDGYDIIINGQSVAEYESNQSPDEKVHGEFTISESGYHDIDMFWWDQGGEHVFKPKISSDGGNTYEVLDSSILFTEESSSTSSQTVEFTLEDFVSDIEDDSNSTTVKIKIVSLPEDGVLTVNGNNVQIGDIYDETAQIVYTPTANMEDTLYGTTANTGTLDEWGTMNNGILTTDDGNAVIKAYSNNVLGEVGFASQNNNSHHDGLGLGVVGSTDDDQIELDGNEKLVIEYGEIVTNAEFGLASLGGHFTPGASQDAYAHWEAYKDGVLVAQGDVKQSTDDNNPTTNSFEVNVEFDSIEFTTTANTNSNFSVQYMNVDYKVDDSFDYIAIDSNGVESNEATVTFDMDTNGCTIRQPQAINETVNLDVTEFNTNLVITFDTSGSMNSKMSLAKEATINMINEYSSKGNVKVLLTSFAGEYKNGYQGNDALTYCDTNGSVWLSANKAIEFINNFNADGGTNYDDALQNVIKSMETEPAPLDGQTVGYFISDGVPTYGMQDTNNDGLYETRDGNGSRTTDVTDELATRYKNLGFDETHSVGIGDSSTREYLEEIALAGSSDVVIVDDANDLKTTLANTISTATSGNVLENFDFGEDYKTITSITIDGAEYTSSNYPTSGVTTNEGGVLVFNFETGVYSYSIKSADILDDTVELFTIKAENNEGKELSVDLTINLDVNPYANETVLSLDEDDTIDVTTAIDSTVENKTDIVDMTNSKANTLDLDMEDVLNLVDSDKELIIKGDYADKVNLDDGNDSIKNWESNGKEEVDGNSYNVYKGTGVNSTVKILIDDEIEINPDI